MLKKDKRNKMLSQRVDKLTVVAENAVLRGDLRFDGEVRIEGRLIGNIDADEGLVSISPGGYVEGIIKAPSVTINGALVGDAHALEHLQLGADARVDGSLHYRFMEMVSGAQIDGQLHYLGESPAKALVDVPSAADFKSS